MITSAGARWLETQKLKLAESILRRITVLLLLLRRSILLLRIRRLL